MGLTSPTNYPGWVATLASKATVIAPCCSQGNKRDAPASPSPYQQTTPPPPPLPGKRTMIRFLLTSRTCCCFWHFYSHWSLGFVSDGWWMTRNGWLGDIVSLRSAEIYTGVLKNNAYCIYVFSFVIFNSFFSNSWDVKINDSFIRRRRASVNTSNIFVRSRCFDINEMSPLLVHSKGRTDNFQY